MDGLEKFAISIIIVIMFCAMFLLIINKDEDNHRSCKIECNKLKRPMWAFFGNCYCGNMDMGCIAIDLNTKETWDNKGCPI